MVLLLNPSGHMTLGVVEGVAMNRRILEAERVKLLIWRIMLSVVVLLVFTRCSYLLLRIFTEQNLFTHM